MNILSLGGVIPTFCQVTIRFVHTPALDVAPLLLPWLVYISLLSLHLAGPASLSCFEFSLKLEQQLFSFGGTAGTLPCKRSSSVQEEIAADHCWVSSSSQTRCLAGDGLSENFLHPIIFLYALL